MSPITSMNIVKTPAVSARSAAPGAEKRAAARRATTLPARLTWKDRHGMTRFASVVTRDVSETSVFVECSPGTSIPMFRLVHFQLERDVRESDMLPQSLRQGRVLSAVYRVCPGSASGRPQGLALRLMVAPPRRADVTSERTWATA